MKLSDYVMKFLLDHNINYIFGYQGGSVVHLIDSLHKVDGLTYIQNYHEQASSFSADAYAKLSGRIGVAIATSGPGATNLITGIANAYFDSVPCLFITGQVSTHAIKTKNEIRQQGFQETDIVSIVKPITKFAITILESDSIRFYLEKAIFYCNSGRPGSVLIDIPHDIQASEINPETLKSFYDSDEYKLENVHSAYPDINAVKQVVTMLDEAKRPVILAGGGLRAVRGTDIFRKFVHACDLPVVCSLMGLDAINHDDEHYCGFIGTYGNSYSNLALSKSDLLLVLGSRLDERQIGKGINLFACGTKIIHVDIDPYELDHNICATLNVCCDVGKFINAMLQEIGSRSFSNKEWLHNIHTWKLEYTSFMKNNEMDYIDPNEFMEILSKKTRTDAVVCTDVGQNMMWVAQSFCLSGNRLIVSSGGHGAMGYSLPAGIGAYFANLDRQIICIMGDGGIQMNLQELQTISREKIPAKIFVLNNASLGMIRNYHEKYFNNKCFGSVEGFTNPNFEKLASAFEIDYTKISTGQDYDRLNEGLKNCRAHFFEIMISPSSQLIPQPLPIRVQ